MRSGLYNPGSVDEQSSLISSFLFPSDLLKLRKTEQGNLFDHREIHVVDLDHYRHGPSLNDMGRVFGSSHFMPPE